MTVTAATLDAIAALPPAAWTGALVQRFPGDPVAVAQALLWLRASQASRLDDERPQLGSDDDARYELASELDAGATSSVWQAFDRKLGRNVAIKCFRDRSASLVQVLAEARAACDVLSEHVVRILDVHASSIVMELVGEHDPDRGRLVLGTAASTCRPVNIAEAVRWVGRVARGVHDAHLRNVFHRDLKPANVLITPLSRRARIADFGLAVSGAAEVRATSAASLVRHGVDGARTIRGTPEYMAPEQARGLPPLDPRILEDRAQLVAIDVWGLGALAYELLAGTPPWGVATDDHEPWELAGSGARPPPLTRTSAGERIPRTLRRICERAMALHPRDRYGTAAELAAELEAFAACQPTSFARKRRLVRVGLWSRRNPPLALAAIVAVALIALVFGARATVTRLRAERDALDEAVTTQEAALASLKRSVERTRAELARTKRALAEEGADVRTLERLLATERANAAAARAEQQAALDDPRP